MNPTIWAVIGSAEHVCIINPFTSVKWASIELVVVCLAELIGLMGFLLTCSGLTATVGPSSLGR